jgi:parallel beta-helix repeat protein
VRLESHNWHGPARNILIEDCRIFSVNDASSWDAPDWNTQACNGMGSSASDTVITGNHLLNVNFGISVDGDRTFVRNNIVENFGGDGLRGNANDLTFEGNTVKNCYKINENHDDGFQSFSVNGAPPRERVVLRGNTVINNEDPAQRLRGALQGIGCFDGWYINWIIENNLVVVDHWHGISLYGAINCRIVNNTVLNPYPVIDQARGIWIAVVPHKNGVPGTGCLIRNNISWTITARPGVVHDHNVLINDPGLYADYFVDPGNFDFRPRADAPRIIDTGATVPAPLYDRDGNARPAGAAVDVGAYEYAP